jgi:hypothetical protein
VARDDDAEARALAAKLDQQGYGTWSQRLTDMIAAGATGTEIVMGLRWVLAQLLQGEDGRQTSATRLVDSIEDWTGCCDDEPG